MSTSSPRYVSSYSSQRVASSSAAASARLARTSTSHAASSGTASTPYSSSALRSRQALHGSEERIVLDLGSRVWKVGFSGENGPRAVFDVGELYACDCGHQDTLQSIERNIKKWLRKTFHDELMVDGKTRKVLILENPMLPLRVKEAIAKALFENHLIPSLSFASSPLCALLSIGRITGLVIDVGNLETCALPIYTSRPLFSHARTSPIASRYLSAHLRRLLKRYCIYIPTSTAPVVAKDILNPIEDSILTPAVIEDVKTRACYVEPEAPDKEQIDSSSQSFKLNSDDFESSSDAEALHFDFQDDKLKSRHSRRKSHANNLALRLPSGTLTIPGWVRHACTDIFFDSSGDVDAPSIPEIVLDILLRLPVDLRKLMIGNILLVGGGSMLPGFPTRLENSVRHIIQTDKRYSSLQKLSSHIRIVNGDMPTSSQPRARQPQAAVPSETSDVGEESAKEADFAWERALMPWIGASLVGSLKLSGNEEWTRDAWTALKQAGGNLGDWTQNGW